MEEEVKRKTVEVKANLVSIQPHCKEEDCEVGVLVFNCIKCDKKILDHDSFFDLRVLSEGASSHFCCPKCDTKMMMLMLNGDIKNLIVCKDLLFTKGVSLKNAYKIVINN